MTRGIVEVKGALTLDIISLLISFAPIIVVLLLANAGQAARERASREPAPDALPEMQATEEVQVRSDAGIIPTAFAYGILILMFSVGVMVGLAMQAIGLVARIQPGLFNDLASQFGEGLFDNIALLALGIWLPSLVGMTLLLPPVRTLLAKVIPIDPRNPVHAVALSLSMLILINLITTLGIGLDNLADVVEAQQAGEEATVTIVSLWMQQLMMTLTAVIGVGWLTRRSWGDVLQRLGIVVPTWRQAAIGFSIGLAMVPVVFLFEALAELAGVQADQDVERLTEELLGALFDSPWGIITLGLAAAIGEEPLFRGAAQPRFGLVLTALLFALVHSNYGITLSTAIVFLLGIVLGLIRIRHNTTTAMITHAVYNITLGLLAMLAITFFEP